MLSSSNSVDSFLEKPRLEMKLGMRVIQEDSGSELNTLQVTKNSFIPQAKLKKFENIIVKNNFMARNFDPSDRQFILKQPEYKQPLHYFGNNRIQYGNNQALKSFIQQHMVNRKPTLNFEKKRIENSPSSPKQKGIQVIPNPFLKKIVEVRETILKKNTIPEGTFGDKTDVTVSPDVKSSPKFEQNIYDNLNEVDTKLMLSSDFFKKKQHNRMRSSQSRYSFSFRGLSQGNNVETTMMSEMGDKNYHWEQAAIGSKEMTKKIMINPYDVPKAQQTKRVQSQLKLGSNVAYQNQYRINLPLIKSQRSLERQPEESTRGISDILPVIVDSLEKRSVSHRKIIKPKTMRRQQNKSMFEHATIAINNTSQCIQPSHSKGHLLPSRFAKPSRQPPASLQDMNIQGTQKQIKDTYYQQLRIMAFNIRQQELNQLMRASNTKSYTSMLDQLEGIIGGEESIKKSIETRGEESLKKSIETIRKSIGEETLKRQSLENETILRTSLNETKTRKIMQQSPFRAKQSPKKERQSYYGEDSSPNIDKRSSQYSARFNLEPLDPYQKDVLNAVQKHRFTRNSLYRNSSSLKRNQSNQDIQV